MTRKVVEIDDGKTLRLVYLPPEKPVMKTPLLGVDCDSMESEVDIVVPASEVIKWETIKKVKYSSKFIIYILDTPRLQFILVPYEAMPRK